MLVLSRIPFLLLVPVIALITLAFSRDSLRPPPPAESGALTWRQLHRHTGEARGPNGLGVGFPGVGGHGSLIYAMAPGQSLRSEDGGATWTKLARRQNGWSVAFGGDSLILIGGQGKISRSADGGKTWKEIVTVADGLIYTITLDSARGIAVGRSLFLRSTDAGATWKRVPAPRLNYLDAASRDRTIVVVGGAGLVMLSEDGGETWRQQWLATQAMLTAVAFADERTLVITTFDGTLLRSTDRGQTWVEIPSPARGALRGIAFSTDGDGLAVGYWGEAIRSMDSGATWQRERSGTRLHLLDVEARPAGGFLVSGVRETVFDVTKGGAR